MGRDIRGLTTAASLWATTGIAMAVAPGGTMAPVAVAATALALIVLAWVNRLERRILPESNLPVVEAAACDAEAVGRLLETWPRHGRRIRTLRVEALPDGFRIRASFEGPAEPPLRDALAVPGVQSAHLKTEP